MEEINILTESIIKIEQVKEEPVDTEGDNSIEDDSNHAWYSVKAEDNAEEELEPPLAVNVEPIKKCKEAENKEEKARKVMWQLCSLEEEARSMLAAIKDMVEQVQKREESEEELFGRLVDLKFKKIKNGKKKSDLMCNILAKLQEALNEDV